MVLQGKNWAQEDMTIRNALHVAHVHSLFQGRALGVGEIGQLPYGMNTCAKFDPPSLQPS